MPGPTQLWRETQAKIQGLIGKHPQKGEQLIIEFRVKSATRRKGVWQRPSSESTKAGPDVTLFTVKSGRKRQK